MLGVLAIVGVLSVGGIAGYSKAMEKFKINKTVDEISHIVANVRTLYAQQTTYNGLDGLNAIKMGVVPDSLTTSDTYPYLTNTFQGNVFIENITMNNGTSYFSVGYSGLPKEACIALASYDWGDRSTTGLIGFSARDYGEATISYMLGWNGGGYTIAPNGCHENNVAQTCIGEKMPLSTAISVCDCMSDSSCMIVWMYQ